MQSSATPFTASFRRYAARLALATVLLCAACGAFGAPVAAQAPAGRLGLSVACPAGPLQMGSSLACTVSVANTGDAPLTNVTVRDATLGLSEQIGSLAPGASAQFTGSRWIGDADVPTDLAPDATSFAISGSVEADSDQTEPQSASWSVEVEYWFNASRAAVGVQVSGPAAAAIGQVVTFRVTVSNVGDVPLANVRVEAERLGLSETIGTLERGASREFGADYGPLTSDDLPGPLAVGAAAWSDRAPRVESRCETAIEPDGGPAPIVSDGRADVSVVVRGIGAGSGVRAWVGGTLQEVLHTAPNARGEAQATWTFYPPTGEAWTITVAADLPAGADPGRWDVRAPEGDTVTVSCGDRRTVYLDVVPRPEAPAPEAGMPAGPAGPAPLLPMPAGDVATLPPAPLLPQAGAWDAAPPALRAPLAAVLGAVGALACAAWSVRRCIR